MKKIIILLIALLASNVYAQTKVVVIPMFDDAGAAKWLGPWESGKAYESGDIVQFDDSSYIALTAHTSSVNNVPPDADTWDLVAAAGLDGIDGADGQDGAQGVQGIPGSPGADGDSAYQVWLDAGNSGSEQDYLDSLVGSQGPQGEEGPVGPQGEQGPQGDPWDISDEMRVALCHSFNVTGAPVPDGFCPTKVAFVTSLTFTGDLGGLEGADLKCQTAADQSVLVPEGIYKAWLSDSTQSANERLHNYPFPYVRTDGVMIDYAWGGLTDGTLMQPINKDEFGNSDAFSAWTGTNQFGNSATQSCSDWHTGTTQSDGVLGFTARTNSEWTQFIPTNSAACEQLRSLYCFQQ